MAICITFVVSLFAGCSSKAPAADTAKQDKAASAAPAATAGDKKVKIEFFHQKSEVVKVFNEIAARFTKENPSITVEAVNTPDAGKVLLTRVATNDIPDVFANYPTQVVYKKMMDEGIMVDLTNEPYVKNVAPSVVDLIKYKDKVYALPFSVNAYGLYYNKDIYAKFNLKAPATFDELISNCEVLKKNGVLPFEFSDKDAASFGQQGERILSGSIYENIHKVSEKVAAGETSFTKEPYMRTLAETLLKLRTYGPPDTLGMGNEQVINDFVNGKCAMLLSGTWALTAMKNAKPDISCDVVPFPSLVAGQQAKTSGTVDLAVSISGSSKNPDAAKKFLAFLTRKDIAQYYADNDTNPSVVNGVNFNVPQLKNISDMINGGKFCLIPTSFWPAGLRDEWQVQLQQLVNKKDVDAFLAASDKLMVQYYKK